jgi:predicted O-methyltransferase YrrM
MPEPWEIASQTKGFLDHEEGLRLYELAREAVRLGPCLEIGGYCGKSTVYIGTACREEGGTLYSVDHHRGSEEQQPGEEYFDPALFDVRTYAVDSLPTFRRTLALAELEETVIPMVCRSQAAARHWATPLGLVFIDGGHAFDTVLADFLSWEKNILPRGYLVFHDIYLDPSKGGQAPRHVYQRAIDSGHYQTLPFTNTLGVLQKR